ncbi:MAG: hypothetical protein KatS3mg050_4768 [Litorilinea sp.]|nr:MAG: hypothetical protein KatS3mg050_4768 [Litorilinea sp.]
MSAPARFVTHRLLSAMLNTIRLLALTGVLLLAAGPFRPVEAQNLPRPRFENENIYGFVLFDVFEAAPGLEGSPLAWDMFASIGKEYDRFWIKSDGDLSTSQRGGEMEFQALYSRLIAPYWELQAGARFDVAYSSEQTRRRGHLVVGLEGLAPYWFELEPALFISQDGDVSASLTGSYDLFVTQRLILQPRLDAVAAVQEVKTWGVGKGINSVGLSLRLRYELAREFAPYLGVSWSRLFGGTGDLARAEGEDTRTVGLVFGLRWWH